MKLSLVKIGKFAVPGSFIVVLFLASTLTPAAEGLGTHRQLGLPPCLFYHFTHIPCPSCGMTTSFTWIMHGHLKQAFLANPMGPIVFLAYAIVAFWMLLGRRFEELLLKKPSGAFLYFFLGGYLSVFVYRTLKYGLHLV